MTTWTGLISGGKNEYDLATPLVKNQNYVLTLFGNVLGETVRVYLGNAVIGDTINGVLKFGLLEDSPVKKLYLEALSGEVFIDRVKLEKGNRPSDWTEAEEDTSGKIEDLKVEFERTLDGVQQIISSDIEGKLSVYEQSLEGFKTTVANIDGRISEQEQTVDGFSTIIADVNRRVTSVSATIDGVYQSVSDIDGRVSTQEQTIDGFGRTVRSVDNRMSSVEQTVNGLHYVISNKADSSEITQVYNAIRLKVSNSEFESQISQLSSAINLRVQKGNLISEINIDAGRTLISSSKLVINASTTYISGTSFIDGAVIKDGTIANAMIANLNANKISTGTLTGIRVDAQTGNLGEWTLAGGVIHSPWNRGYGYTTMKATGEVAFATASPNAYSTTNANLQIWHDGTIRFGNSSNRIYIDSQSRLNISSHGWMYLRPSSTVYVDGWIYPWSTDTYNLGSETYRWRNVYTNRGVHTSSDVRLKKDVNDIPKELYKYFEGVKPKMYEMYGNSSFGYVAQDVERALYKYALDTVGHDKAMEMVKEFNALEHEEGYMSLIYDQIHTIKTAELEDRIKQLEEILNVR